MKTLFIRIVTFYREGVGFYKRLGCSQSIFEKPKLSVCFITSCSTMLSYCMNFCSWLRTVKFHLFITFLAYENKNKHVLLVIEQ